MLINKITTGYVVQIFDTKRKEFIRQDFFQGDPKDLEHPKETVLNKPIVIDNEEFNLGFDMVQPDVQLIELFDLDGRPCGILRTNADNETLDALIKEYSALEHDDKGSDDFTERCKKKYPNLIFELFYTDTERVLTI